MQIMKNLQTFLNKISTMKRKLKNICLIYLEEKDQGVKEEVLEKEEKTKILEVKEVEKDLEINEDNDKIIN